MRCRSSATRRRLRSGVGAPGTLRCAVFRPDGAAGLDCDDRLGCSDSCDEVSVPVSKLNEYANLIQRTHERTHIRRLAFDHIRIREARKVVNDLVWYSAGLTFFIIRDGEGIWQQVDSVVLLRCKSFQDAFASAIEFGRREEREYMNAKDERIRWAFVRVATIDELGLQLEGPREVWSQPREPENGEVATIDSCFDPESNLPGQTGV